MKTIIWKEYKELWLSMLIMVLFGVAVVIVMHFAQVLDSGTLAFILLIVAGPHFCLLIGKRMFSTEFDLGTYLLLLGLPISRTRIWLAKLLFLISYCCVLYISYSLLILFTNDDPGKLLDFTLVSKNVPKVSNIVMFVGLPATFLSLGYFVTMLPNIFGLLIISIFYLSLIFLILMNLIQVLNLPLVTIILTGLFLISSYFVFLHRKMTNSVREGCIGIGIFTFGVIVALIAWYGLDVLVDSIKITQPTEIMWISDWNKIDSSIIFTAQYKTPWWDPLQHDENGSKVLRYNLQTRKFEQIGRRLSESIAVSPNRKYLVIETKHHPFGIIRDKTLKIIRLADPTYSINMEPDSEFISFLSDDEILFYRLIKDKQNLIQFYRMQIGGVPKPLLAFNREKFINSLWVESAKAVLLIPSSDSDHAVFWPIEGKEQNVSLPGKLRPFFESSKKVILWRPIENIDYGKNYFELRMNGELTPISEIPTQTNIIAKISEEEFLGARYISTSNDKLTETWELFRYNVENNTVTPIITMANVIANSRRFVLDSSAKYLIIRVYEEGKEKYCCLDLTNGTTKTLSIDGALLHFYPTEMGKFLTWYWDRNCLSEIDIVKDSTTDLLILPK